MLINAAQKIMKTAILILCVLLIVVTIWTYDLHELMISKKRSRRIKILKTDMQQFTRKLSELAEAISGFLRLLNPYIIGFLKCFLRQAIKFLILIGKILAKWLIPKLKENIQNNKDCENQVKPSLKLTLEENLELTEALGEQPYDSPTLEKVFLDHFIAVSYEISAAGRKSRYEETKPEEFEQIVIHRIRNFIATKRKAKAYVYIIAATPTYLHFAVTYTQYGMERLMQIYPPNNIEKQTPPLALEETIQEEEYTSGTGEKEESHMKLGYFRAEYTQNGIKVPLCISLSKKTSNILVAGKSGSGKSLSARWYIWNMLHTGESLCYIADYKGGEEYTMFEGSPSYASGENAIKMVDDFYELFTTVRNNKVRLEKHCTLFIEEWFGLLTYAETKSKSLKNELMAKVGEMLAVSRGLDMGLLICVQRADAALFSSGSREQCQCVISFGRCSAEQFRMLGFSGELTENPTQSYKSGEALVLIDGQESIHEMIVPLITNPETLCRRIRSYLDRQPDICSLARDVAGGGGTGQ